MPQHYNLLFEGAAEPELARLKAILEGESLRFPELPPGRWYEFDGRLPLKEAN